uniref:Uncharacterized protein n=1 Tax=Graphocephala atropunctata TaxID=36148 RepID=A0A1B6L9B6_9HEMI
MLVLSICKKLNTSIYVIKQIKSISGDDTAKTAYYSIFETHVRYGIVVWGGSSGANLQRTLILQKKCIRVLAGLQYLESCKEAFKSLKILTVIALYIREAVMYVDGEDLPRQSDVHKHNTRHAAHYNLPSHHLSLYQKKPSYSGRKLYNHLPQDLQTKTGKALKTALTKWLLDRPFYTLSEFYNT